MVTGDTVCDLPAENRERDSMNFYSWQLFRVWRGDLSKLCEGRRIATCEDRYMDVIGGILSHT